MPLSAYYYGGGEKVERAPAGIRRVPSSGDPAGMWRLAAAIMRPAFAMIQRNRGAFRHVRDSYCDARCSALAFSTTSATPFDAA